MKKAKNTRPDADILHGLLQMERRRVLATFDPDGLSPASESAEDRVWREHNTELHPFREIMVILKGDIPFQLASRVCAGHVGDVVLVDSFETHDRFHPPGVRNSLTLWLQCCPQTILCIVDQVRDGVNRIVMRFEFSHPEFCTLLNCVWRDAGSGQRPPDVAKMEINGIVNVVMGAFAEKILTSECQSIRRFSDVQNRQYQTVMSTMAYISRHMGENPQLEELAKQSGYSTPHFARLFRQYSGYGFRDYMDLVRMGMYRTMYFIRHMHKKEIALELGFASSSSLIHWLRSIKDKQALHLRETKQETNVGE